MSLVVDLRGVSIEQAGRTILRDVNFKVAEGEFCYLIGRTGSGKSSLLKTLYAALPLYLGTGTVAGFDLTALDRKTIPLLRRKLGVVFQDFNLLTDRDVNDNLRFALEATGWTDESRIRKRIIEVLDAVGLADKGAAMPYALSGGEQQRVSFARAMLNHPRLLIADEATGNLDPETSDEILLLMRKLARAENTAVIFATHDYRILENFQARIVRCHDGRIWNEEEMRL